MNKKWILRILPLLACLFLLLVFGSDNVYQSEEETGTFAKRRADAPINWKKVELVVIWSEHDSFLSELRKRKYPYWYINKTKFQSFLDQGGVKKVDFYNEKGKKSKKTLVLNPKRQVILSGCSDYIRLTLHQIYKLRQFVANGGYIFTNCWGVQLMGQVFPDYIDVLLRNDYPDEDIKMQTRSGGTNIELPCDLKIDPQKHDLFIGLEKIEKEITFLFSGARRTKIVHKDVETLFYISEKKTPGMIYFQFKEKPLKLSEKQIETIKKRQLKSRKKKKKVSVNTGSKWELKKYSGRCLNFLPHFVEQAGSNRKVADIRDTIFYNFIVLKQDTYDAAMRDKKNRKKK